MKKLSSKTILGSAIASAILVAGMSTSVMAASGAAIDYAAAGPTPIGISQGGQGDVLLFPFYATQNNYASLLHLVNTSDDMLIVKIRYRDFDESKDAMDFTAILSPHDVFAGYAKMSSSGLPIFTKADNSCTSPRGDADKVIVFPSNTSGDPESSLDANKHTGHIEVIVEGVITKDAYDKTRTLLDSSVHVAGATLLGAAGIDLLKSEQALVDVWEGALHNSSGETSCTNVDKWFTRTNNDFLANNLAIVMPGQTGLVATAAGAPPVAILAGVAGVAAGAAPEGVALPAIIAVAAITGTATATATRNPLNGHFTILDADGGVAAAGRPVALANAVGTAGAALTQQVVNPCGNVGINLICDQDVSNRIEHPLPNLMNLSILNGAAMNNETTAGHLVHNQNNFFTFEQELAGAFSDANEWSAVVVNGVASEIIITQPLKYIHRDKTRSGLTQTSNLMFVPDADQTAPTRLTSSGTALAATGFEPVAAAVLNTPRAATIYTNATAIGQSVIGNDANAWDDTDGALGAMYKSTGCIGVSSDLYDREEQQPGGGTGSSGGAGTANETCTESTAYTFGGGVTKSPADSPVNVGGLTRKTGYIEFTLDNGAKASEPAVIGYAMWNRTFGSAASAHYGQIMSNM